MKQNILKTIIILLLIIIPVTVISKGDDFNRNVCKNNNELTSEVKLWLNDTSFWSDYNTSDEDTSINNDTIALSAQIRTWISNGDYWVK